MAVARTALVVGGGIAGPVVAMALRRAGVEAVVYEAHAGDAAGAGAVLALAPNGLDALRVVGAEKAVRAVGQPQSRTVVADGRGRRIGAFPGLRDLPPGQAMWRSELFGALHGEALAHGVPVEFGKRLIGVDEQADGVIARFADGSSSRGDVLVGADGIRSTVRTVIDPEAPDPVRVPLLNFGAAADISVPAEPETAYFVFGRRAFLGYWRQPDGRTAWFGNLPYDGPMTAEQARSVSQSEWLRRLQAAYGNEEPGRRLLEHTRPRELVVVGPMEIMPSVPHWHRGRMVLVGDAVHAPYPSSGQGASLAVESAVQLARCLRDLPDVPGAFAAYEALRRPRVERVAARAARTDRSKTRGPVGIALMRLAMPLAMRTFLNPERTLGPEQRYRIDWDAPVREP